MSESDEHKNLKNYGRTLLLSMGFMPKEIIEEYRVSMPPLNNKLAGKTLLFIVDLCAFANRREFKKSVAVECGKTDVEKISQLKIFFDEVIHLPYNIEVANQISTSIIEKFTESIKILEDKLTEKELAYNELKTQNMNLEMYYEDTKVFMALVDAIGFTLVDTKRYSRSGQKKFKDMKNIISELLLKMEGPSTYF